MQRDVGQLLQIAVGAAGNHFVVLRMDAYRGNGKLSGLGASLCGGLKQLQIPGDPTQILPQIGCCIYAAGLIGRLGGGVLALDAESHLK